MIYYLIALILGITLGFLLKGKRVKTEKYMLIVLILLIFFLGVNIGNTLNIYELSQVGILSIVFSITTVTFSYLASKIIRSV